MRKKKNDHGKFEVMRGKCTLGSPITHQIHLPESDAHSAITIGLGQTQKSVFMPFSVSFNLVVTLKE